MNKIKESGHDISMLVAHNNGYFSKKATGKITFICNDGKLVEQAITKAIETGEGQIIKMASYGINSEGIEVSNFIFDWTIKLKK